jgi:peptide/nickel transport system substrate-binding protein
MGAEPGSLNFVKTGDSAPEPFYYNVYEGLTQIDANGKVQPMLATSWQTTGKTWVAQIRSGVKWQDGSAFTAADAAASVNEEIKVGDTSALGMLKATATSDSVLTIDTAAVNPEMPQLIARIPIEPASKVDTTALDRTMDGTGPYKFVKWDAGSDIVLARNDAYWGTKANFAKATFYFRPDTASEMAMLQSGEANIAYGVGSQDAANAGSAYQVWSGPANVVIWLRPKFTPGSPLADVRIRQAINMAIDRQALISGIYHNLADDPSGQPYRSAVTGFNPNIKDATYDPAKAKALLQQAGAVGMTLTMNSGPPEDKVTETAQAVQQMLQAVGLKIKLKLVDNATWRSQNFLFGGGKFDKASQEPDLIMNIASNVTYSAYSNLSQITCTGSLPGGCDQRFTDVVTQSQSEPDLAKRVALYQQAGEIYQQDAIAFPLVQTRRLVVTKKSDNLQVTTAPGHKLLLNRVSVKK